MESIMNLREMKKSSSDKWIAGVCGGLGEYTPLPSWVWRAIFLATLFIAGFGMIAYVILWICMPAADPLSDAAKMEAFRKLRELRKSNQDKMIAGVCGGLGEHTPLPSWLWRAIFLFALFVGGFGLIAYLILWISLPRAERSSPA
jgi:phage shock protein PspC (stress-responsive transcriptional regulator)